MFDGITYTKGAAVLNTFEAYVGPDKFQRGVREYLKARAWGNATSAHFVAAISAAANQDLAPAFATFLDQAGAPEIEAKLACANGAGPRVELAQQRYVPPGSPDPASQPPWHVPVCVVFERDGKRAETCTVLDKDTGVLALDTKTCPRWLMPNANGRGYYRVHYAAVDVATLRDGRGRTSIGVSADRCSSMSPPGRVGARAGCVRWWTNPRRVRCRSRSSYRSSRSCSPAAIGSRSTMR